MGNTRHKDVETSIFLNLKLLIFVGWWGRVLFELFFGSKLMSAWLLIRGLHSTPKFVPYGSMRNSRRYCAEYLWERFKDVNGNFLAVYMRPLKWHNASDRLIRKHYSCDIYNGQRQCTHYKGAYLPVISHLLLPMCRQIWEHWNENKGTNET